MVFISEFVSSLILAAVQGITEWFPISSSGHLVLFHSILDFEGSLVFDVALHFGTLMAVFVYFGGDIVDIIRDLLSGKWHTENGKLGLMIAVSTVPAALVGYMFEKYFESAFSSLMITAIGFSITGLFLLITSFSRVKKKVFGYGDAILVGVVQSFALFPGISRSGTTIGAGMLGGLDDKNAIKFSFLMSIPITFGANILVIGNNTLPSSMILPTLLSFVVGLAAIYLLYGKRFVTRRNLRWYALYALILSFVLIGVWLVSKIFL